MAISLRPLALAVLLTVAAHAQSPTAPQNVASRIVGTWELMTRTVTRADGTKIVDPVLGEKPLGRLVYDASGAMSLQMMRTGRKSAISTPANANQRVTLGTTRTLDATPSMKRPAPSRITSRDRCSRKISMMSGSGRSRCKATR